jgi:hypothetical protein
MGTWTGEGRETTEGCVISFGCFWVLLISSRGEGRRRRGGGRVVRFRGSKDRQRLELT